MNYSEIPDIISSEDDPAYIEAFRGLIVKYVQKTLDPSYSVVGLTPGQEKIPPDFQKPESVQEMLAFAEQVLGYPVPEGAVKGMKDAAAKETEAHYYNFE